MQATNGKSVGAGVAGGLVGGIVFGAMMAAMGMMAMVAMLVESEAIAVGWGVHLAISVVFGAVYGAALRGNAPGYGRATAFGAVYGVVLWVIGALLIMPLWLGMPLMFGEDQIMSLVGHLVFGVLLGVTHQALLTTGATSTTRSDSPV